MKILSLLRRAAVVAAIAIAVLPGVASAADQQARRDINQVPTLLGLSTAPGSGEIRNIRATTDGFLLVVTTGAAASASAVTATQGPAAATAGAWPVKVTDGTDTADVTAASALKVDASASTQPVSDGGGSLTVDGSVTSVADSFAAPTTSTGSCPSGSAQLIWAANAAAKGSLFRNEGTSPVRVGGSGVTSTVGFMVDSETTISTDGEASAFRGSLYCTSTTGVAQAFSTYQGQ